jgi:hypothetical protein
VLLAQQRRDRELAGEGKRSISVFGNLVVNK